MNPLDCFLETVIFVSVYSIVRKIQEIMALRKNKKKREPQNAHQRAIAHANDWAYCQCKFHKMARFLLFPVLGRNPKEN